VAVLAVGVVVGVVAASPSPGPSPHPGQEWLGPDAGRPRKLVFWHRQRSDACKATFLFHSVVASNAIPAIRVEIAIEQGGSSFGKE